MTTMLRMPRVVETFGKSRCMVYNWIREGLLTKPVSMGPRTSSWPASEIEAILKARIAGYDDARIKTLVSKLMQDRQAIGQGT